MLDNIVRNVYASLPKCHAIAIKTVFLNFLVDNLTYIPDAPVTFFKKKLCRRIGALDVIDKHLIHVRDVTRSLNHHNREAYVGDTEQRGSIQRNRACKNYTLNHIA